MKLRCKKFLSPLISREELETCTFLTKGKEYIVLGIGFDERTQCVYIDDDTGQMIGSDIRQFDIVSNYVPSRWAVRYIEKHDYLSFFPKTWIAVENFWDRLVDDQDPDMIALYEQERDLIYQEEP